MLTGKPARVSKARRIGLVDRVFPRQQFRDRSLEFVRSLAEETGSGGAGGGRRGVRARRRRGIFGWVLDGTVPGRAVVLRTARKQVLKRTRGHYPAPLRILDVVRKGVGRPIARSLELEARAAGELVASHSAETSSSLSAT